MSAPAELDTERPAAPAPELSVLGAEPLARAAAPTLVFTLRATDPSALDVYSVALSAQISIDPARRTYDPETRELLVDLFGAPERWSATAQSFTWTREDVLVPSFTGETTFELPVLCNYDLEVAATKYFYALPGGFVPLSFHFSGTVFYRAGAGRLQLAPVPWTAARYRLPVDTWRRMIAAHYARSGWIRLGDGTLARLRRRAAEGGHPTFDACVADLLDGETRP